MNRRRFQFRLRTAFVVVTAFCLWCWSEARLASERHKALEFYGAVESDATAPRSAPWPLNWLGEKGYFVIGVPEDTPDGEVERLRSLFPEAGVLRQYSFHKTK